MPTRIPAELARLLQAQGNVVARRQQLLSTVTVDNALRTGDWQRLQRGIYAPHTGEPGREARLWAALLRSGPGAALSHWTAAERYGLLKHPSHAIHITVPANRNPARSGQISGVIVHRSDSVLRTTHPAMTPPCVRIEDTILDLIAASRNIDEAYAWIIRALAGRRAYTTPERLRVALDARAKVRWRRDTELALSDTAAGIHSWLERQYIHRVERPHGLPQARRQVRVRQRTGSSYLDNLYERYGVCVELDGAAAHPADEQWRDKRRDNHNLVREGILTLRFGFLDLRDRDRQCQTAAMVADLLRTRAPIPAPTARPCTSPSCLVKDHVYFSAIRERFVFR